MTDLTSKAAEIRAGLEGADELEAPETMSPQDTARDLIERFRSGDCPFCGRDPYHYVDNGVGMERVAVTCCDLGIALFQDGDEQLSRASGERHEAANALSDLLTLIEQQAVELAEARGIVRDIYWMALRYADGRKSYAVGMCNDAVRKAYEAGWLTHSHSTDPAYARDGMSPEYEALETRATAAEAERAEHLATIARLEGERDEARRAVAAEEARHGRVVQGFVEVCDAVGVRFDAPEAVAYEINVKIGNAEHRLATAESTIATQSERIALLEAALKLAEAEAYDLKYAAAGGEDAPGSAHAVTVADVERWRKDASASLAASEATIAGLRAALVDATKAECSNAQRMREAIVEARRRLAKGRSLWNGPCHECDGVLDQALRAENDIAAIRARALTEGGAEHG